jgi:hypothetical protein
MPHVPVLMDGWRRRRGGEVVVINNAVAQDLPVENTFHQHL